MGDYARLEAETLAARTAQTVADCPLFAPESPQRPFPAPKARRTDPETSHAAAASMGDAAGIQRAAILAALVGVDGLTNDELDAAHGWRTGTASRRTVELLRAGQVIRGPDTRLTEGGRAALVYRIHP